MSGIEFWCISTVSQPTICSKHKTQSAAERAATKCESLGGWTHKIIMVLEIPRKRAKRRSP